MMFALLGAATASAQRTKTDAPAEFAVVAGIVLDRSTGLPLPKVLVTLSTEEDQPLDALTLTDAAGGFQFENVPPGRYVLHADLAGYLHAWYGAETENHPPGILTLHAAERRNDLLLRLEALGTVSGVVADQDGDPMPDVPVSLWRQSFWRGRPRFFERFSAISNDRGAYRIYNVVPGCYLVMANGLGHQAFRMQPEANAGTQPPEQARFGLQFYPGTERLSAASLLSVAGGKETAGIDFHMGSHAAATLRGTVAPPDDVPPDSQAEVTITPQDLPDQNKRKFVFAVPGPHYAFEQYGLAPGEYLLVANLSLGEGRYRGVQRVVIGAGAEKEVALKLDSGMDLAGTLRIEGDAAGSPRDYRVELSPGDELPLNEPQPAALVKADGSFALKGVVPGVWDIGVNPIPRGGYLKSMRLGEQDVLTEDMVIGPGTAKPLRIVISLRGGTLEVDVKKASGEDARRAIVLLAPVGRYAHVLSFYSEGITDEAGHAKLEGLTPGSYKLYAFESMESRAWEDSEFLKPFESYGEKVEIGEGTNPPKKVELIRAARSVE